MRPIFRQFWSDDSGLLISSELVIVGTVGVLAMVVGLEAVSSAVIGELNDLSSAFGAISQTYNYRSIAKAGHARVTGSGFNDAGDFCDCVGIVQTDVVGKSEVGVAETAQIQLAPATIVNERVIGERVINEVLVDPPCLPAKAAPCPNPPEEIIEERIIRRRVIQSDCSASSVILKPQSDDAVQPTTVVPSKPSPVEVKPKKN